MSSEKHQCEASVFHGYASARCSRNGSVERNGKWYCKQHDPLAKAERDKARQDKWDAEMNARRAVEERIAKCRLACEGFDDPMELRRQRDEAVNLLRESNSLDHRHYASIKNIEVSLHIRNFLAGIDIEMKGESK